MTHRQWTSAAAVLMAMTLAAAPVLAQGVQTGIITGTVTSEDGLSLPGATVTVTAPTLQGARSAVTDVNGNYVIRGLPPGEYSVTIELSGMAPRKEQTVVALGRTTTVDAQMSLAGVAEAGPGRRRGVARRREPGRRRELPQGGDRSAARRPHAPGDRGARAGADRQHAEHRAADDLGRLRVRQRLPDRRRGRQRQLLRGRRPTSSSRMPSTRRRC